MEYLKITEGNNVYTTNRVENPTGTNEPTSTPQTGDTTHLQLWITVLALSAGGILTTALLSRKKKESEE